MKTPHCPSDLAALVQDYQTYLVQAAGLASQTCAQRGRYVTRFLRAYCAHPRRRLNFDRLDAAWLRRYVLEVSTGCQPRTLQCQMGALRSFLRFLTLTGRAPAGLDQALAPVRAPDHALGHSLSAAQLRSFLRAFDGHQPVGMRDYAMALLAAKLGLRAKEIAQLSLDDLDWEAGTLCLQHTKGRRSRLLPLPTTAGVAIAKYLRVVRAPTSARQVFLCWHRPRPHHQREPKPMSF